VNKMARKRNKLSKKQQDRNALIMMYARALNLYSIEDYQEWCRQHGFGASLNKTRVQLEREYQHHKLVTANKKLKQNKREGNLRYLVQKLYTNEIKHTELNSEALKLIYTGFNNIHNKRLLRDVLLQLDEKTKLLNYIDYVKGVISFVAHFSQWLRPIAEWQPKTRNADRQFASLARHLYAQYEVPAFMDTVWHKGDGKAKGWFIHIGKGNNIRTAKALPIKMTKKMAHCFLQAPSNYDVNAAFRWAQIHALGGNKTIADAVAETRMARSFSDDDFWLSVLRFFIANPMLDTSQYNPIVDYIWHQKYENRMVFVERGVVREDGPEQPNFSMQGRTADTLLRQVDNWHRQLGKESRGGNLQWVKSKLPDFRYVEGRPNNRNMRIWTIRELLGSRELIAEGREQHHCVATYARSCFSGSTSIWTMDCQESQARQKCLTIELHNATKSIRQVRGLRNRMATARELDIIHRWAHQDGLTMAGYL
jgi:hypothetical protein